jgi:hypothetical protein
MKRHTANPASDGVARPIYFISDRPEAYEYWGEVGHMEAKALAHLISAHAAKRFPNVEFRIDSQWHSHDPVLGLVAAYIDSHWREWATTMAGQRLTA